MHAHLRSFDAMRDYPPTQVLLGNLTPAALEDIHRPWYRQLVEQGPDFGPFGRVFDERGFYERLAAADVFSLIRIDVPEVPAQWLGLYHGDRTVGYVVSGHPHDESQAAPIMLENLACKVSAAEAAKMCLAGFDPLRVD